jgi:hypothetical protein
VFFDPDPGVLKKRDSLNLIRSPKKSFYNDTRSGASRREKEGLVEELFKKMSNFKLEQNFQIMESFTSF